MIWKDADKKELFQVLLTCWGRDTSYDPANWTPENPAHGQCLVTSLALCYLFGGQLQLVEGIANGVQHFWNRCDGEDIDFTSCQFTSPRIWRLKRNFGTNKNTNIAWPIYMKLEMEKDPTLSRRVRLITNRLAHIGTFGQLPSWLLQEEAA